MPSTLQRVKPKAKPLVVWSKDQPSKIQTPTQGMLIARKVLDDTTAERMVSYMEKHRYAALSEEACDEFAEVAFVKEELCKLFTSSVVLFLFEEYSVPSEKSISAFWTGPKKLGYGALAPDQVISAGAYVVYALGPN